jgi:adenylate kinase family enzyme
MSRICILGNAGGGKSTLARSLAVSRGLPHIEIDRFYWQADWSVTPSEIYERQHAEFICAENWIIDGGGAPGLIAARMDRATEVILIDMPLWMHFWLAAERQIAWATGKIEHPPGSNLSMPPTGRLFEIISQVDANWLPILRRQCDEAEAKGKIVTRLKSVDELNRFVLAL